MRGPLMVGFHGVQRRYHGFRGFQEVNLILGEHVQTDEVQRVRSISWTIR
jgi:hypothetical protein